MRSEVLIVDDSELIRNALSKFFERDPDFHVCGVAENGREAIQQADRLHPDLIILDLAMPVMNGLDAARILKRTVPTVPLIMYSAFESKTTEQLARQMGVSDLVSKSDNVSVLMEKARILVSHKAA